MRPGDEIYHQREIFMICHDTWFLSKRSLWETEIIKGGSVKEFQAVPFDVSFSEHMVFIHWSLVVGVLQKEEQMDKRYFNTKRQGIGKLTSKVPLIYRLSTGTSYLTNHTLCRERKDLVTLQPLSCHHSKKLVFVDCITMCLVDISILSANHAV